MYYAVIMAGGTGTRLWPLSRQSYPKHALKLVGDKTVFQYAVERIRPVFPCRYRLVGRGQLGQFTGAIAIQRSRERRCGAACGD